MLDGWNVRNDVAENRCKRAETVAAYFIAHLLNVSGKTIKGKISVKDLAGPLEDQPKRDKKTDRDYLREQFPEAFQDGQNGGE